MQQHGLKRLHVSGSEPCDLVEAEARRGVALPAAGCPTFKQALRLG